jgi:D-glycero-D-manno-heptose 1,7-bisphosphate phosphatase
VLRKSGAVFVDRDGVIVRNRPDYVKSWPEVEILPGALAGLRLLAFAGQRVFVITNQSAIGRGVIGAGAVDQIHARLSGAVAAAGGWIEAFLVCPHAPDDRCPCRKPGPGLLHRARDRYGIDLRASCVVGDHSSDVAAASAAGCRSILVLSGRTPTADANVGAHHVVPDLLAAARLICEAEEEAWHRAG